MSIYLHFRAVSESDIQDDHTWLAAFMSEAWESDDEYAAGIAHSISKSWDAVNDLYAAAESLSADAEESWNLPIYGGRPVPHNAGADPSDPPMMFLEPAGVSQAAQFLTSVSFDELWNVVGARFSALGRPRQEYLAHHRDLQGFYERAASAGHAVVKVVWA
ncbi:DUF1877 family protein [Streptomyces sp. NPDC057494]|uniref:DUF1877 family protein n=1 Tax=Streptomyces sp. NPDC057494 TaxID=3346148 RepID=UPI0036A8356D